MKKDPEIVKILREEERLGTLQNQTSIDMNEMGISIIKITRTKNYNNFLTNNSIKHKVFI